MTVAVVGNAIEFEGYHIARISTAVPATVRDRFESALETAYVTDPEPTVEDCGEVLKNLLDAMKELAEVGMVEVTQIQKWIETRNVAK